MARRKTSKFKNKWKIKSETLSYILSFEFYKFNILNSIKPFKYPFKYCLMETLLYKRRGVIIFLILLALIILTFLTTYYGSNDIGDYADTAKFFAGKYSAKIRNPHNNDFGFVHAPFVKLTSNFISFKITSLIFLFLIIISVYMITKDKKSLWIMLLSPIVWYMAPWISPIQIASLLFLWCYYFIDKYDRTNKLPYLIYSGIFGGLSWNFWNSTLYFGVFLTLAFLYNKKLTHLFLFIIFIFIGMIPHFILDYQLFNFPFYNLIKGLGSLALLTSAGGIYSVAGEHLGIKLLKILLVFLAIPIYFWKLYKPSLFKENKKTMIFLTLSLVLLVLNPQIRFTLALVPITIILLTKNLNKTQFKRQIIFSIIIILIFIFPYLLQINNNWDGDLNGKGDITQLLKGPDAVYFSEFNSELINKDIKKITEKYPNEVFVVGNKPDYYQSLAHIYWGNKVKEFVSIEDYELVMKNQTTIFSKKFSSSSNIRNRRQIWVQGGLDKNPIDDTNYEEIKYGIGINEPLELEGFGIIEKYNQLYLSKKVGE